MSHSLPANGLDLPPDLPAGRVEAAIRAAAQALGLIMSLESALTSYPGSQHWHLHPPHRRGVLELTWWPRAGRLWPKVNAGRAAPWIDEASAPLLAAVEQSLNQAEAADVATALKEAGLPSSDLSRLLLKANKRIYRAGDMIVQLWYGREGGRLARSGAALQAMSDIAQVPKLVYTNRARQEAPYQVEISTLLPGESLEDRWPTLDPTARRSLVHQLGALMAEIHEIDGKKLQALRALDGAQSWAEGCRNELASRLGRARRSPEVDKAGLARVAAFIEQHQALLDLPPLCLVHTDIHFGNLLIEGDKLTGLIDFEFAEVGGRDRDAYMLIGDSVGHMMRGGSDDLLENHTLQAVRWLGEEYPALYATPGFAARQLLYLMLEPEEWHGTAIERMIAGWTRALDGGWIARWFDD